MKSSILFIGYDSQIEEEIIDYIREKAFITYFARTQEEAVQTLNNMPVNVAVLNVRSLNDAIFLRYINRYYPESRVVISASKEFDEMISIFNQQSYSRLPQPLKLEELNKMI